jgi:hypothetical protein
MVRKLNLPRASMLHWAVLGILAVPALGAVAFAWSTVTDPIAIASSRQINRTAPASILAALQPNGSAAFAPETLASRPLFSPSRRQHVEPPPEPEPARVEEPAPVLTVPPPAYIIGGVMVAPDVRKTLLRREPREPGRWLSQGEITPDGWTVVSVRADGVVLGQGGQEVAMPLRLKSDLQ